MVISDHGGLLRRARAGTGHGRCAARWPRQVSAWVDELERHGRLPDDAEGVSVELSGRVRSLLVVEGEAAGLAPAAAAVSADWLGELPETDRIAAFAETIAGGPPLLAISSPSGLKTPTFARGTSHALCRA